jgi:type IV secretory pathway TrbL component
MAKKGNYYQNQMKGMMGATVGTLVGTSMLGATSSMVQGLPAGTAKTIAGTAVGLQGVALLGPSMKYANDSLGINQRSRRKSRAY